MNEEKIEKANQKIEKVKSDIRQARDQHDQMELDIGTSVKNIEIQLERDLLTKREYVFFMEQLEMVKGIERNEAEEFQDYEYELKRIQNRLEEEKEYLEKEEKEEAEDK